MPLRPKTRTNSPNVRLLDCRHGRMLVNTKDSFVGRSLAMYGEFTPDEARLYQAFIKPGSVVIDAGAHMGCFTLLFSDLVGPRGHVYAFEPQRQIFHILCGNLALNGIENVTAEPAGVGQEPRRMIVPSTDYSAQENFGGLALLEEGLGDPVRIETIDGLALERCDLIKADVQGMERSVLLGAVQTVEKYKPLLYLENDLRELSPDLLQTIEQLGYRAYWHIAPLFEPSNYRKESRNIFPGIASVNLLCTPRNTAVNYPGLRQIDSVHDWWQPE